MPPNTKQSPLTKSELAAQMLPLVPFKQAHQIDGQWVEVTYEKLTSDEVQMLTQYRILKQSQSAIAALLA